MTTTDKQLQEQDLFGYDDGKKIDPNNGTGSSVFTYTFLCNPRNTPYRYFILTLLYMTYFFLFFIIELPTGLQVTIINVMNINAKQYNLLFSVYTWPDLVLSVFGGILIDRVIGLRIGILLLALFVLSGQTIFALGMFLNNFTVALLGRIVQGCGIGLLKSTIFVFVAIWFKGKELNFISALGTCFTRTGTTLGILAPQHIYDGVKFFSSSKSYRLGITSSIGVAALALSFICCIFAVMLDKRGDGIIERTQTKKKKFRLSDLKDFSISFWLSTLPCGIFFSVMYSYAANGQFYIISKFGFDADKANLANSLIFLASIMVTPLLGILMDITGYSIVWGIAGLLLGIVTHGLYITSVSEMSFIPYVAAIMYSLSYSIFVTAMYPIPVLLVQEHQLATAYSLYNVQYCISFATTSVITGFLIDYNGFLFLETFFFLTLCFVFSLIIILLLIDVNRDTKILLVLGRSLKSTILKARTSGGKSKLDNNSLFSYTDTGSAD